MNHKNFTKFDFKKFIQVDHYQLNLKQLRSDDHRKKLPVVNENTNMKKAIETINLKKLGFNY